VPVNMAIINFHVLQASVAFQYGSSLFTRSKTVHWHGKEASQALLEETSCSTLERVLEHDDAGLVLASTLTVMPANPTANSASPGANRLDTSLTPGNLCGKTNSRCEMCFRSHFLRSMGSTWPVDLASCPVPHQLVEAGPASAGEEWLGLAIETATVDGVAFLLAATPLDPLAPLPPSTSLAGRVAWCTQDQNSRATCYNASSWPESLVVLQSSQQPPSYSY